MCLFFCFYQDASVAEGQKIAPVEMTVLISIIAEWALATYLIPGCVGRGVRLGSESLSGGGAGGVWKSGCFMSKCSRQMFHGKMFMAKYLRQMFIPRDIRSS